MVYSSGKTRIAKWLAQQIIQKEELDMRYSSGKTRVAKPIGETIISREFINDKNKTFCSLFCGGLSVETRLAPYFDNVILNDKQEYLIELYKAVQNGWLPPEQLTEEEYKYIKQNKDENKALTAFAGFGCSFGGKWFGGYGRHGVKGLHVYEKSMCEESRNALIRDIGILKNAKFVCKDYRDVEIPDGAIVYADPPYKNKMSAFGINEKFNSDEFWDWCRDNSKRYHIYISELEAPEDFIEIWRRPVLRQIANCNSDNFKAVEKLFIIK